MRSPGAAGAFSDTVDSRTVSALVIASNSPARRRGVETVLGWGLRALILPQACQGPFSAIAFGVGWESEQSWPVKKGSKLCNCKVHGPCNKHWRLVLGCIDAAFSNRIFWFQHVFLRGRKPSRNHRKPAKTNEIVNFLLRNRTFRFMQT